MSGNWLKGFSRRNLRSKLAVSIMAVFVGGTIANCGNIGLAAEKNIADYSLDEYVVTATKTEHKAFEANANISVVTSEDIERMHYSNLEEVLRTMTNVQFLNYGLPGYNLNKVRINGSDAVLVLVDGVRVNGIGTGQQMPFALSSAMENIERIEVLKGAAAVLYGSDAKGGVINIITKKSTEPRTKISAASGNFGKEEYKFSNEAKIGDFSYRVYGQKSVSGSYEDGNGVEWDTHDNAENIGVMLKQEFAPGSDITLNYTHGDDKFSLYDHLSKQDIDGYYKQKNVQVIYNQRLNDVLTNTFSINDSTTEHVGVQHGGRDFDRWNDHFKSFTLNNTITAKLGDTHVITGGFEKVKSENLNPYNYPGLGPISNAQIENKAYFLQDEWSFDDKWKLTSGIRYDSPENSLSEMENNISKSFNLGYKFDEMTNVYAAYNDYFILPSMRQLYDPRYGNAKLLPEKGKNYEIGFNHMLDENTMLNVHYFNRNSEQNIGFDTQSSTYINDQEKVHGFDIQLDKQFDEVWNVSLGYSRMSYANRTGTTDKGYLPKNLVTMAVTYTKDKWDIGVDGKGFIGRDGNDVDYKAWPSNRYWVFNAGINYKATDNIKVFGKCNNIFNQEYAEHTNCISSPWWPGNPGDWYGMPGRNFVVGMEMSF